MLVGRELPLCIKNLLMLCAYKDGTSQVMLSKDTKDGESGRSIHIFNKFVDIELIVEAGVLFPELVVAVLRFLFLFF